MDASANNLLHNRSRYPLGEECSKLFLKFLLKFEDSDQKLKYVETAKHIRENDKNSLPVSFSDVMNYDEKLSDNISLLYYRLKPYLNDAAHKFVNEVTGDSLEYTCYFLDYPTLTRLRDLRTENKGHLIKIRGHVIRSHSVHPELILGTFKCRDCGTVTKNVEQEFVYTMPSICVNTQCSNRKSFELVNSESKFIDFQKLYIQEVQEEIPKGNVPRGMEVILRSEKVESANPGDICELIGTLIAIPDISQIALPGTRTLEYKPLRAVQGYDTGLSGIKGLGVRQLSHRLGFLCTHIIGINNPFIQKDGINDDVSLTYDYIQNKMSKEEIEKFVHMSQDPNLIKNMCDSMFPHMYGNIEIKKGLILMLLGGVPKITEEGTKLRGDINICIVGDPSTGKSRFLKRIQKFSARSVYTSGKASSAAGLTAAVVRDPSNGEFVIEAGALMLANNGVCCIDEFDKMELHDQVAIHEAMEQQTISITKAGVKATLSAKCSVLAAANPIFGVYDRSRSLRQNINLTAPLMSRFDLFFVLLDDCDENADYEVGKRVMQNATAGSESRIVYSEDELRRYISFAHCFEPKVSFEAADQLEKEYKLIRQNEAGKGGFGATTAWRITVRQLESLIRLSEALAKLNLSESVTSEHVKEAVRLLSRSIVRVIQPDVEFVVDRNTSQNGEDVENTENVGESNLTVTFDKYKSICRTLINKLKEFEDSETTGAQYMRRSELTEWYFNTIIDQIADEDDYLRRKLLLEKIIERMIEKDNLLMSITRMELDGQETEDPFLTLHPNVPLD